MKRSQIQGAVLLLVLLLIGAAWLHRGAAASRAASPLIRESEPSAVAPPELPHPTPEAAVPPRPPPEPPVPATPAAPAAPPRTIRLSGKVTDAQGAVLPFVKVEGFFLRLGALTRVETESDAEGAFHAECPLLSQGTFTAHLPGHGRAFYGVALGDPERDATQVREITLSLRGPIPFDGFLAMPDGSPAAGARVTFHPFSTRFVDPRLGVVGINVLAGSSPPEQAWDDRCRKELFLTDCRTVADASGRIRGESLVAGVTYLIEVEREGMNRVVLETHVRGQKKPALLQLPP